MRRLRDLLLDQEDARVVEDELAELYELRRQRDGERAATRWRRRQRRTYPWLLLADRLRTHVSGPTTMPHLWRDIRYALRSLGRVPVLTTTLVLTLGIGLGTTAAMLTLARAVLLQPLPYADAGSLVWIYTDRAPYRFALSLVDYRALEADHPAFAALAAFRGRQVTITQDGQSERVQARIVTGSYFPLLGHRPHLGRLFTPADDGSRERIVVLSHDYWSMRLGRDPQVLGRSITLDGVSATVVGVMPRTTGPLERELAIYTPADWPAPTRKGPFFTNVLARLKPDVSRDVAAATLRATNARLFPLWRSSYQDETATWGMLDLKQRVIGEVGPALLFVVVAVACVLVIACVNAVNLLVARSLQRHRELAIRGALGASRGRLLQLVLAEAAALTAGAAVVGFAVAVASLQLVRVYGAEHVPRVDEIGVSAWTLGELAALSLLAGLIVGVVPAWRGTRLQVDQALRASGRSATDGPATRRVRRALVAAEFALATPLLVAAALVLLSLDGLARVPVGVDTGRLLTAMVSLPTSRYPRPEDREAFWKRTLARLDSLPGVESAALADGRPPRENGQQNNFELEDRPTPASGSQPVCPWVGVSPQFFQTAGLRLERGRLLDDRSRQEDVVVVDRAWGRRFFPGQEVIGRRFRSGGCTTCPWTTVVGVVADVKWAGLDASGDGTVYYPFVDLSTAFIVLRARASPATLIQSLRQEVKGLDPGLAVSEVATGDELMAEALATPRYLSVLIGLLASAALALAVVGIYGVMAFFVQQHTRDIGIRLALGGDPAQMRWLVLGNGARLVGGGVILGVVAAMFVSWTLSTMLFGVSAADLRTLVGVPLGLLAIASLACLIPAYRASRLDPADVLKES